ncbi:cytochrome-c oxidase, cbb3-type subunit II [Thiohalomonas denitrificans]|uniref:Cytochrome c oxidase cbb3-type subunit 2 n=1 Tax=Thiohalomonas denitrificans TaxID=415747 RepID=A0A1G5QGB9_9GAMM|nr:cytochrome-c oxidase, cbb3-type subunit II [Thiohalomonas denitrificans]SCZ60923.1 cytochrome c oxidase cbb3-type subunit 2 [Thiohalomonas denitrificans]
MADKIYSTKLQDRIERNVFLMFIFLIVLLSVGGLVEIVPLFFLKDTMEHNKHPEIVWERPEGATLNDWQPGDGVRPYKPLELAGRDVYLREGCYTCHSQMIRPFRDENERYGHYSLASESMYDHPFQWGSKRTGPDLARVGGKYSDEWHTRHLRKPRSVVPESVMPNYPWLEENRVDAAHVTRAMRAMQRVGVPYTEGDVRSAAAEVQGANEMDAVVAYLQSLGTHVKFEEGVDYRE